MGFMKFNEIIEHLGTCLWQKWYLIDISEPNPPLLNAMCILWYWLECAFKLCPEPTHNQTLFLFKSIEIFIKEAK